MVGTVTSNDSAVILGQTFKQTLGNCDALIIEDDNAQVLNGKGTLGFFFKSSRNCIILFNLWKPIHHLSIAQAQICRITEIQRLFNHNILIFTDMYNFANMVNPYLDNAFQVV